MKILNLYAGIGGNRKLWGDEHDITAVELDISIAKVYKKFFPTDKIIVGDAHEYLLDKYKEFDFIWSSPPCQSHGQYRHNVGVKAKGYDALYPDMALYQEIILLRHHYKGLWVVENTRPYYTPLIEPNSNLQRHFIWSNFEIENRDFPKKDIRHKNKISDYDDLFSISTTSIKNKRQVLRNCVDPELGLHILNQVIYEKDLEL